MVGFAIDIPCPQGFSPAQLRVSVLEGAPGGRAVVQVEGRHEARTRDGKGEVTASFARTFTLPADVDPDDVRATYDGTRVRVTARYARYAAAAAAHEARPHARSRAAMAAPHPSKRA